MDVFIHWAGFLGAWLLVAGPLLQGALELRDEEMDREGFERVKTDMVYPEPISRWWWLLPPVAIYKNQEAQPRPSAPTSMGASHRRATLPVRRLHEQGSRLVPPSPEARS